MFYFAYGSNMNWEEMHGRCPSAKFKSVAKLKDHRLVFSRYSKVREGGVADVLPSPGQDVWGVVYEIDDAQMGKLDRHEGVHAGKYVRQNDWQLHPDGGASPIRAAIYLAVREQFPPRPGDKYKQLIVVGAEFWHLPPNYVQELKQIQTA